MYEQITSLDFQTRDEVLHLVPDAQHGHCANLQRARGYVSAVTAKPQAAISARLWSDYGLRGSWGGIARRICCPSGRSQRYDSARGTSPQEQLLQRFSVLRRDGAPALLPVSATSDHSLPTTRFPRYPFRTAHTRCANIARVAAVMRPFLPALRDSTELSSRPDGLIYSFFHTKAGITDDLSGMTGSSCFSGSE